MRGGGKVGYADDDGGKGECLCGRWDCDVMDVMGMGFGGVVNKLGTMVHGWVIEMVFAGTVSL